MNESATSYVIDLNAERDHTSAELIFALTRTTILSAELLNSRDDATTLNPGPGPYVPVPLNDVAGPITITLTAVGEPLQGLYVQWHRAGDVVPTDTPVCLDSWAAYLAKRAEISETNECQKFFYEIDRRSLADLLHCHEQVDNVDDRLAHVTDVNGVLETRLATRWAAKDMEAGPALDLDPIDRAAAVDITHGVFMKAAEGVKDIKDAFIRFASGWERVEFPGLYPYQPDEVVTEPNGWKIFMFAEFAIAALEVLDHECAEARFCAMMLPTFLAIQRIYVERRMGVEPTPDSFCGFAMCGRQHPEARVDAIRQEYDKRIHTHPHDPLQVQEAIRETLLAMGCNDFSPKVPLTMEPAGTSEDGLT